MADYLDPKEEALKYLSNISDTLFDPASADIQAAESAPFQRTVVGMYGAKAPGHVTTASTTKSVLVYYDPEATLSNGQNTVQVVERDASNTATSISTIDVGLPSNTYSSAGVLSSTLSVKNTGSDNNRTGTITSGVLLVPDESVFSASTAQILNQVYGDRQNDTITSAANDEVL